MNPNEIEGYIRLAGVLIELGIDTAEKIKAGIKSLFPHRTDAELNVIIDGVAARARERRALALAEAEKAESLLTPVAPPAEPPADDQA